MARYDIGLLDNDLIVSDAGDFAIRNSDQQHVEDTINAFPGWWKMNPDQGVGVRAWLGGPAVIQELSKVIRLNLQADGYTASPVVGFDQYGTLKIAPNATI